MQFPRRFWVSLSLVVAAELCSSSFAAQPIPPHAGLEVNGLHAYADAESVAAGGAIRFHVSSQIPYRFSVARLGLEVDNPGSDEFISQSPQTFPTNSQPIHPGSYIHVGKGLPADAPIKELTLECWVRPWNLKSWQGLITQHNYPDNCGYGLFINGEGQIAFSLGTGGEYDSDQMLHGPGLKLRKWHHVVATWDGSTAVIWLDGQLHVKEGRAAIHPAPKAGAAPLRIGAYGQRGVAGNFLNGDIAAPAIYTRALSGPEIANRFKDKGLIPPSPNGLAAHWPLDEEKGSRVRDASGNQLHGRIINHGTWMIGGPSFDATKVPRYGGSYDPGKDANRGHSLRLADDDLYDCRWAASHEFKVPPDAKSGIYAAWFEFELNDVEHRYPVTFIVRKATNAKKAPIALLTSTTTWRAYSGAWFAKNVPREDRFWPTGGPANDPANAPSYNLYRDHRAGQPTYQVGLRLPWPAAGPDVRYSAPEINYSHLMRAERFTHSWLEREGYDFDVYTSLDLHRDPDLLKGYKTLILNGHDEYWSIEMYEGVDKYLESGGNVAVLSGNTMFWRVSFNDDQSIMECRKFGPLIGGRKFAQVGEIYHSHDGKRGSLMRHAGYPAYKVIGLECTGWWGGSNNGVYTATDKDHFLFNTPEKIDWSDRATFGHAAGGVFPRAGGHEGDARLSSFAAPVESIPEFGFIPEEPKGIETIAKIEKENSRAQDYFARWVTAKKATLVDMIYWERPNGGRVFHAGAIAFGWTLDIDPKQAALMRNVLHKFDAAPTKPRPKKKQPNIVFILTDNQGAWQLGCYGNPDFKTPHIDRMASEGVRFTRAFANNAVCSPTRATYLTGLTPSQHGVHRYLSAGRLQIGANARYTLEEFTTLPEVLHHAGYTCGLSGKWHLGANATPQDGFSFWVTKEHGHSPGFLNQKVLEDGKTKTIPKHLSEYWTDRGIEFIEAEAKKDKPFFLFLAYNGPYTLSGAMREKVPSPWSDPYVDHHLPSFPRPAKIHPWQRNQHDLIGDIQAGRNLAGQVTAVDAGVGRIMETLKRLDLDEDTLVIYAADQGAVAGHAGFWGMGDHTRPLHGRDGTTHIPMIFRWPGKIPAERTEDRIVTNYDFMPSLLSYLKLPMPTQPVASPGRDFSPALRGKPLESWDDEMFYEFENVRSIRTADWKYVERLGEEPAVELFNLQADPDELTDLSAAKKHKPRKEELQKRLHAWFAKNVDPKWDLWKGGKSKTRIGTAAQFRSALGPDAGQTIKLSAAATPQTTPTPTSAPTRKGKEISPEKDHSIKLASDDVFLSGGSVKINPSVQAIAWWKTTKDTALWKLRNVKPGKYTVVLEWAAPDACAGQEFIISNQDKTATLRAKVQATGGWGKFQLKAIGEIELPRSSINLSLKPAKNIAAEDLFDLRRILLLPEGSGKISDYAAAKPEAASFGKLQTVAGNKPAPVLPGVDESLTLMPATASIHGDPMTVTPAQEALAGWTQPEHAAVWEIKNIRLGTYDIHAEWAMPDVTRGGLQSARITLDGQRLHVAPIRTTGGKDRYASYIIGTVTLPAGDHRISFGPNGNCNSAWMRLRSLRFHPANQGEFHIPPLTVPEGFEVTAAAIPPLVKHPMMACLDDRGRMFISESAGINAKAPELLEKRPHQILMLEDKDNDGVYDKSTVFAENLVLPNGAQWLDNALYVCSPPYVWKFEDTDDDGKADKQTPINGKFGFNGMSSAFHGPTLGPDGRLYWCGGQHGWTLGDPSPGFDLKGPWTSRAPGVFSSWPDGSDTRNHAHGGKANPVEVTFTAEGEVLGTVAVYDGINGRHDAVLHWMHGAKYNLNPGRGDDLAQTSYPLLPPVSRRGWVAPPGLTRYRSGAFGPEYKDDLFMCEFNTHRVYRLQLERKGASFTSTDQIFLESSSPYTHFTDVFEDADGSLLVVDTGGWFLYGCPTSSIEKPEVRGAIYRISKKGAATPDDPRGLKIDWAKSPEAELAALLDDSRFTVRDKAIQEFAGRGDSSIKALELTLALSKSERARRNAIWALTRMDSPVARTFTRGALEDASFSVRLTAARSVATRLDPHPNTIELLLIGLDDDEPAVRRECAAALGRMRVSEAVPVLLQALEKAADDRFLQHALIYALIEIGEAGSVRAGLTSSIPAVQQGSLIALDQMPKGGLKPEELSPALKSENATLRNHAIRIATSHKWAEPITAHLRAELTDASKESLPALEHTLLAFADNADVQSLISKSLTSKNLSSATRQALLHVIANAPLKQLPKDWPGHVADALASPNPNLQAAAIGAVRKHNLRSADKQLTSIAKNSKTDTRLRVAAIAAIAPRLNPLPDALLSTLLGELGPSVSPTRRVDAARVVGASHLAVAQRARLLPLLKSSSPLEFGHLLNAFADDKDPESGSRLLAALSEARSLSSLTADQIESLAKRYADKPVTQLAAPLIKQIRDEANQRESRLADLETGLKPGNPDRGLAAFTKAACNVCHKIQGEGGVIGPELTNIGSIRTTRDLLEAIAYPNATFAREYEPMTVNLRDGEALTGRITREDKSTVHLMNVAGEIAEIDRATIQSIETSPVSLMPTGLEHALTNEELSDLIAFLRGLK
ncbi:MAG: PVC-type heme-binding CxxCH protein [Verrucomicrobiia bacterium]|jgi:putative membrane-bound dehydrogenase-like protein